MAKLEVTAAQWWALSILSRTGPEGMTQAALARDLESSRTAVGNLLDRLEAGGYVVRWDDPRDGRAKLAAVTDKAMAMLDRAAPVANQLNNEMFDGLGAEALSAAATQLAAIRDNIRRVLDRPHLLGLNRTDKRALPAAPKRDQD